MSTETASERAARSGPLAQPRICCLDLDTFFVSVERVLDPTLEEADRGRWATRHARRGDGRQLRGAPAGREVGHVAGRGGQRAPDAIYLPTRGDTYGDYAERVREIARRFSPTVLVASIDEMFLDFSGCERLYGAPRRDENGDVAVERAVLALTGAIDGELGLPASAGLATSKVMAKVASAWPSRAG